MANTLITPNVIAKMAMIEFKNTMVFPALINRDFEQEYKKVGDTITFRRPIAYSAVDGPDITSANKDTLEGSDVMTLSFHKTVPLEFTAKDMTLAVTDFNDRYVRPAAIELGQQVETAIASTYNEMYWFTGTPGTTPATFLNLGAGKVILDNAAVPQDGDRSTVLEPTTGITLADGLKSVFLQDKVKTALEEAKLGRYAGFNNYVSVSNIRHTVGDYGGTPLINGGSQGTTYTAVKGSIAVAGSMQQSLVTDGWSANKTGVLKKGDVFTIANVFAVNPKTRQSTGALQTFVVLADANSDGSGNATLTIAPPILPVTGASAPELAYATVTAAPADNAAITVKTGTANTQYAQNMLFHKKGISLAMRPFEKPDSAVVWEQVTMDNYSLTLSKGWDVKTYKEVTRLDVLFGVKVSDRRLCARLTA